MDTTYLVEKRREIVSPASPKQQHAAENPPTPLLEPTIPCKLTTVKRPGVNVKKPKRRIRESWASVVICNTDHIAYPTSDKKVSTKIQRRLKPMTSCGRSCWKASGTTREYRAAKANHSEKTFCKRTIPHLNQRVLDNKFTIHAIDATGLPHQTDNHEQYAKADETSAGHNIRSQQTLPREPTTKPHGFPAN